MSRVSGMRDEELMVLADITGQYLRDPLWPLVCPATIVGAKAFLAWYFGESDVIATADDIRGFAMHMAMHMSQWITMWP
jgi:hypothetical protein